MSMTTDSEPSSTMKEYQADCRFKQARKFIAEGNLEDAIDLFAALLQSRIEEYGDLSLPCAEAYFEYGNALLMKEEENPSNGLLGNGVDNGEDGEDDQSEEEVGCTDNNVTGNDADDNDPEGDLQIAWEVLDVARCIWERSLDPEKDSSGFGNESETDSNKNKGIKHLQLRLSDTYTRLGDLMRFNSNLPAAIDEYEKALALRKEACAKLSDSLLSEVHFSLAVTYVYLAGERKKEKEHDSLGNASIEVNKLSSAVLEPICYKQLALQHYDAAKKSIELWLKENLIGDDGKELNPTDGKHASAQIHDKRELVDTLQETIDALKTEMLEDEEEAKNLAPQLQNPQSTHTSHQTSIGFGCSTSACNSQIPTLLQVRKKSKKRSVEQVQDDDPDAGVLPSEPAKRKSKLDENEVIEHNVLAGHRKENDQQQ